MCEADASCERQFKTMRGMQAHMRIAHKPEPIVIPKKVIQRAIDRLNEDRNLLNAKGQVDIGDVVYITQKCVVVRITETEGSRDLDVELQITKSSWSSNK